MKFKLNGLSWEIIEVNQEKFWEDDNKEIENGKVFFGRTKPYIQQIWIDKGLTKEQKRKTLYHELMHCYIMNYFSFNAIDGQDEELWCDISASSHDIIHKIVEDYFK